jgi:hypothetical protein
MIKMRGLYYTTLLPSYAMEQHALKHVNSCQNTKIYLYLVTSGACIIKLITAVIYGVHNMLECLYLAILSSLV